MSGILIEEGGGNSKKDDNLLPETPIMETCAK
jgi:hypothetical protein